jgi:hypothetical protein
MLRLLLLLCPLALASPDFDTWVSRRVAPDPNPERAEGYRFVADHFGELHALAEAHPEMITPFVVGHSVEQRPIWGFRIRHPGDEIQRTMLVFAQLHALEWIGAEVATTYVRSLLEYPPRGLEEMMGGLPAGVEVVVVPIVNVDGRWRSEQDLINDRVHTYRRGNARQVDLNRDWGINREATAFWRHFLPAYYATTEFAFSQPESRAIDRLAAEGFETGPPDAVVSLHAFGGYIYYPWGGRFYRIDDRDEHERVGALMAEAQVGRPYKVKQLSHWGFLFRIQGAELDHFYGTYGSMSYLIELTRSGIRPLKPSTWRDYFRWYNPEDPTTDILDGAGALLALTREMGRQAAAERREVSGATTR